MIISSILGRKWERSDVVEILGFGMTYRPTNQAQGTSLLVRRAEELFRDKKGIGQLRDRNRRDEEGAPSGWMNATPVVESGTTAGNGLPTSTS